MYKNLIIMSCPEDNSITSSVLDENKKIFTEGKVKNVFEHPDYNLLTVKYTDKLSCFNKYRCDIKDKGLILNYINLRN